MAKRTVLLLLALITVIVAAGAYKARSYIVQTTATRQLTAAVQEFAGKVCDIEIETAYGLAHPDFISQQTLDEFAWYSEWLLNHLGAAKGVKIEQLETEFTAPPYSATGELFMEFEKGTCKAHVRAQTVDGDWRIQSLRLELPSLLGKLECPKCGASDELRRICVKCGEQILSVPGRPLLPEPLPQPAVDLALLSRYTIVDPAAEWRSRLYEQRDFDAVGRHLQELLHKCDSELGAYEYTRFCAAMTKIRDEEVEEMLECLAQWATRDPKAHFPLLLKGYALVHAAWKVRGSGWPEEVPAEPMEVFVKLLKDASEALMQAERLNDRDPEPPSLMIAVAQGLTLPSQGMEQCYAEAVKRCPMNFGARARKLDYLALKWSGSWEEQGEFVKECTQDAEKFPLAGTIQAHSRAEMDFRSKYYRYLRNKKQWANIKEAYTRVFEHYPDLIEPRLELAYLAYKADDYATAREQFDAVGDRWTDNYYWSDLSTYHRFRAITLAFLSISTPSKSEGLQLAREAVAMAPDEPYPHYALGCVLCEAEKREEALAEFVTATTGAPLHGDAFVSLAYYLGGFRRYGECYRAAERALLLQLDEKHRNSALEYLNGSIKRMAPPCGLVLVTPAA